MGRRVKLVLCEAEGKGVTPVDADLHAHVFVLVLHVVDSFVFGNEVARRLVLPQASDSSLLLELHYSLVSLLLVVSEVLFGVEVDRTLIVLLSKVIERPRVLDDDVSCACLHFPLLLLD
jgi:hypothetical protein